MHSVPAMWCGSPTQRKWLGYRGRAGWRWHLRGAAAAGGRWYSAAFILWLWQIVEWFAFCDVDQEGGILSCDLVFWQQDVKQPYVYSKFNDLRNIIHDYILYFLWSGAQTLAPREFSLSYPSCLCFIYFLGSYTFLVMSHISCNLHIEDKVHSEIKWYDTTQYKEPGRWLGWWMGQTSTDCDVGERVEHTISSQSIFCLYFRTTLNRFGHVTTPCGKIRHLSIF